MRREPAPDNSTNTVLIVLGVVFGALLLLALGCGLSAYFVFRGISNAAQGIADQVKEAAEEMKDTETAARSFLNEVSANRTDQAWASATQGFQARQTKEEFRAFVNQNPSLKRAVGAPHFMIAQTPGTSCTYQYTLDQQGMATCTLQLFKEDGRWRVDSLTVP